MLTNNQATNDRALVLARDYAEQHSIQKLADLVGFSRSALSLFLGGKYNESKEQKLEKAILAKLDVVQCPHLAQAISQPECHGHASAPFSFNPIKQAQRKACRGCPNKPEVAE